MHSIYKIVIKKYTCTNLFIYIYIGPIIDKYFVPVVCFLNFNLFDWAGRTLAQNPTFHWPCNKLWIPIVLRIAFIPMFLICHTPTTIVFQDVTLLENMTWPLLIVSAFALSNGYLGSLCFMYSPSLVTNVEDEECAGLIMSLSVVCGLMVGSFFSFFFVGSPFWFLIFDFWCFL